MATHLPALFRTAGLADVRSTPQDEGGRRGEPGFEPALALWAHVIDTLGRTLVAEGALAAEARDAAASAYAAWRAAEARRIRMALAAVEGRRG
jgi:hypothetical protein